MIPLLFAFLASGALGAAAERKRQALAQRRLGQGRNAPAAAATKVDMPPRQTALRARLARANACYQEAVQRHLDPLLMGRRRSRQLLALSAEQPRLLSPAEQSANRALLYNAGALGLLALASLSGWPLLPLLVPVVAFNVRPLVRDAWRLARDERRLSILHLLLGYLLWLWLTGYYLIGIVGLLLGGLGRKIELLTQIVARHSLTQLLGEQPARVFVLSNGVELEIACEDLRCGDILVLDAGQTVPVDGVIVAGVATLDQHRLTGESQPVDKGPGESVLAATLVVGGRIQVRVERTGHATRAAQIAQVLNRTVEQQETRIADQFQQLEHTRLPMLVGGALGWLVGGPTTGVAVIGCNYLIGLIPLRLLALLNGLQAGVEHGILIKDGRALERLPGVDTLVFDKTGTLTLEQPRLVRVHPARGRDEDAVLRLAAAAEQRQTHPIARAILTAAAQRQLAIPPIDAAHLALGLGLAAQLDGQCLRIGSARFLAGEGLPLPPDLESVGTAAQAQGHALIYVALDDAVQGAIEVAADVRPEAAATVAWLKRQGLRLYIVSGDQPAPTRALAAALGLDGWFADTGPEQKADKVRALQAAGRRVCFVGDGINDALALRQADASVSLRGATTVATDAAQVVLMDDDLTQLTTLWTLAQRVHASLDGTQRLATRFSLGAAGAVLLLPYKFWIVEFGWFAQTILGVRRATRTLLPPTPDAGAPRAPLLLTHQPLPPTPPGAPGES